MSQIIIPVGYSFFLLGIGLLIDAVKFTEFPMAND